MWVVYALISSISLSLSVVFAKCGSKRADASIVTCLRTLVTVIFMWAVLFINGTVGKLSVVSGTDIVYMIFGGILLCLGLIFYHTSLKSGTVTGVTALERLTSLLMILVGIFLYGETSMLYIKIICVIISAIGIILIVTKTKRGGGKWLLYGILAVVAFVGTTVLLQTGVSVPSTNVLLTLTFTVVLTVSLISVFIRGLQKGLGRVPASEFMFNILSGLTAGGAWYCYNNAAYSDMTGTSAIVGMSILVSAGLSSLFLKEKISWKAICGLLLITVSTLMYEFMV